MRRLLPRLMLSLLCVVATARVSAQEVVTRYEDGSVKERYVRVEGKREGRYESFHPNGKPARTATYVQDLMEGECREWWPDGATKLVCTLEKGRLVGEYRRHHENGALAVQGAANGCANGDNAVHVPLREGVWTSFYPDGKKRSEGAFAKDLMTGPWKDWHESGALAVECTMQEGQLTGEWSGYFADGKLAARGTAQGNRYHSNFTGAPRRTGVWTEYYRDGKKKSEGAYAEDLMTGPWKDWHENGELAIECTMKEGQIVGVWTSYGTNGKIALQGSAEGNRYHSNFTGAPRRTGVWTGYHPDGKKKHEGEYAKDHLHGAYREWHANGALALEARFVEGYLVDLWTAYDEEGRIALQGRAAGNKYHADFAGAPIREGVWVTYKDGQVVKAELFAAGALVRELPYATDSATGRTKISYAKEDGTREVVDLDERGARIPTASPAAAAADPASDLVAMAEDPTTGAVVTTRRNPDGTTSTYRGTTSTDADGATRVVETDKDGNRITTVYGRDGATTVTRSRPGENEIRTTTTKDGVVTTVERRPTGETKTSRLGANGVLVHEIRDREGKLLRTVRENPDGWLEKTDAHGNTTRLRRDDDGGSTVVRVDRSGNVTTVVRDRKGDVVERTKDVVAPREPGRAYFEDVLHGDDWDDLPPSLKNRYAASERLAEENRLRQAERDAAAARDRAERARIERENAAITEEGTRKWEAIEAERVAAEKTAAERKARFARRDEIARSYAVARDLQAQYDAAIARGDKAEARRIMALQDAHHERSIELLEPTAAEAAEMERVGELQARLAREATARAYAVADERMKNDARSQDAKETVTGATKFVSLGSQMQQETKRTTRGADRERALAEAKIAYLDERIAAADTTAEEKEILRGLRETAQVQADGAAEMLAANARLTAAGYALDGALTLTGGKLVQGGAHVARAAVGAARTALTGRAAAMAGKTTINLAADAGGALTSASRMSAAELAASQEARAVGDLTRLVGDDLLTSASAATAIPQTFTRAQLARLHMPGANLSSSEILLKAEIYRIAISTKAALRKAIVDGADDAVVRPLQDQLRGVEALLREAQEAGRRAAAAAGGGG